MSAKPLPDDDLRLEVRELPELVREGGGLGDHGYAPTHDGTWPPAGGGLTAGALRTRVGHGRSSPRTTSRRAPGKDSLDRLVEWPAEREILGDVAGRSILDLGCGNGGKLTELVRDGAVASVGVGIAGNFRASSPSGVELIQGDLSEPALVPGLSGCTFDRMLFPQSFGYARDPVHTLRAARAMRNHDDSFCSRGSSRSGTPSNAPS